MKKLLLLTFSLLIITLMLAQKKSTNYQLNIATYNLRLDTPRDSLDAWKHRKDNIDIHGINHA